MAAEARNELQHLSPWPAHLIQSARQSLFQPHQRRNSSSMPTTRPATSVGDLHCSLKKAHALLSARSGLCDANHGRAAYLDSVLTPYNDFLLRMQTSGCPVQYVLAVRTIFCAWVDASSYLSLAWFDMLCCFAARVSFVLRMARLCSV